MLLTLYYMYATLLQWWRISSIRKRIAQTLTNQTALVFYEKEKQLNLCKCHGANFKELLFSNQSKIGCSMLPKRRIFVNTWMPFSSSTLFPLLFSNNLKLKAPNFPVLIQSDLNCFHTGSKYDLLQIGLLGVPIAWTADHDFSLILKTDLDNFAKLVTCFLSNSITINDGMEVLQIETVDLEGEPSGVENEEAILKKINWPVPVTNHRQWTRFVDELKRACKQTTTCHYAQHENIYVNTTTLDQSCDNNSSKNPIPIIVSEVKCCTTTTTTIKNYQHHHHHSNHSEEQPETSKSKFKSKSKIELKPEKHHHHKGKDKLKPKKEQHHHHHHHQRTKERRERFVKKRSSLPTEPVVVDEMDSSKTDGAAAVALKRKFVKAKPPNVLVYADGSETKENVKIVLNAVLNRNRYTIYELPATGLSHFVDNSVLIVVCGNVDTNLSCHLLNYLLNGGSLLCLCSNFLNSVLNTFTTAEVREHELVRFSYSQWKQVKMMHHIFCYQASPAKKLFSQDSDHNSNNSPIAYRRTPSTVDLHHNSKTYTVQVRVLGEEETWQTPSILLATVRNGTGKAVFSQVHLEIDPTQYQNDENRYTALKESNQARLEILQDILSTHLDMDCAHAQQDPDEYTTAYFLGAHESKLKLLSELTDLTDDNVLKSKKLTVQFYGKEVMEPPVATSSFLPISIYACPEHFSTVEYFDTLRTKQFGRLVIYTDVITCSMDVIDNVKFAHGLVVLPARQTAGAGRGGNAWLSPIGCAMFSMQVHIPMQTRLGNALSLLQHLVSVAIVSAIRSQPGYEQIELGLKWPNDIYADASIKIGGIILNSFVESSQAICNIGSGTNLNNALPTTCINALIQKYNQSHGTELEAISYERYLSLVFNEFERIYDIVQAGDLDYFYRLYYKYWLHGNAEITVQCANGSLCEVIVSGIDQFGFLTVTSRDGVSSSVEPDGNTFDMMQGLIAPKIAK